MTAGACVYCDSALGSNELLESFPVGKRLAYDVERARLWAICPKCEQWNLAPLDPDERHLAIAKLERIFEHGAARGAGTTDISVADVGAATLTRIGAASWREFAGWRYGRRLKARRRAFTTMVALTLSVAILGFKPLMWLVSQSAFLLFLVAYQLRFWHSQNRTVYSLPSGARVRRKDALTAELVTDAQSGWVLFVEHSLGDATLQGREAVKVLSTLVTHVTPAGASQAQLDRALEIITRAGGPDRVFAYCAKKVEPGYRRATLFRAFPYDQKLALDIASHEEAERLELRAEANLAALDWKGAEHTADIVEQL